MVRCAAIDIGTNTLLLTIADVASGDVSPLLERAEITRLGEGVDRTGVLSEAACARTLSRLRELGRELDAFGVERVLAVGTSALRDASGGEEFLEQTREVLGERPRVVPGEVEAELTFEGAVSDLELDGSVLVVDIGGGSTEVVCGEQRRATSAAHPRPDVSMRWARSLDVGSVRLFERCIRSDPPAPEQLGEVRALVRDALRVLPECPLPTTLVGVAGTITQLAALTRGLAEHRPGRLHGTQLDATEVAHWAARLSRMSLSERLKLPALDPGRADVLPVGATLALEVLRWAGAAALTVSDRGVRYGLLQRAAAGRDPYARRSQLAARAQR